MSCSRNEVVLLPIPFTDLTSRKVRPAIIIGRNGADLFLVPITSQLSNTDFALKEWRAAGLNVPCGVKAQIATVEERLVVKIVGVLTAGDRQTLSGRLKAWFNSDLEGESSGNLAAVRCRGQVRRDWRGAWPAQRQNLAHRLDG